MTPEVSVVARFLLEIVSWIWGLPLIILLMGTGLFLTVRLGGLQFRHFGHAMGLVFGRDEESQEEGDISHFQSLMTALAATVGTGNIVGVATAIYYGGPGALFWMWVTGLVGMASKYTEALLAVRFRVRDTDGTMSGGPMYYLARGLPEIFPNIKGIKKLGRVLGVAFALFAVFASFGIGNMTQANSVAEALLTTFEIPTWQTAIVLATLTALVILGGIRVVGRATEVLVPFMIVFYMGGALIILFLFRSEIPGAFELIFERAFSNQAVAGGLAGEGLRQAIQWGVKRGLFSNESGLGSAAIAAAAARTRHPVRQALISMTQTFIDTLVVCSCTGLVIIVTNSHELDLEGIAMTLSAFERGIGQFGPFIVTAGQILFAYSTVLGWSYYGEKSLTYLVGVRFQLPYRAVFIVLVAVGSIAKIEEVWAFADIANGLMAVPNLIALLLLSGVAARISRAYFRDRAALKSR